jgi:HEAT repeat protein
MLWSGDSFKSWLIVWGMILFAIAPTSLIYGQEKENRSDVLQVGKDAVRHYENNEMDKAIAKFNQFLLANPTDKEALQMRETAGKDAMIQMLMQGGEISRIARAILLYAERSPIRKETDAQVIKKYVEMAATGNLYQRHEAIALIESQVGELAIPEMLPYLAKKDAPQINIILAIKRMGGTAVVPLIEVLNTSDRDLKQQVAMLLGHIGDARALPDLKRVVENVKEKDEVRRYAEMALQAIAKKPSIALPPSKELYYQKALAYYKEEPTYKPVLAFNYLYWRWQDEKLVYQEVQPFAYTKILGEHACFNSLATDATSSKSWALLVRIYNAIYTEIAAVEGAAKEKGLELSDEELAKFMKEKPYAERGRQLVAAAGIQVLYDALHAALQESHPEVTVKIIEDIGATARGREEIPAPLFTALRSTDKRIRYAAAESLVNINPLRPFRESAQVIQVLQEALGEWDTRSVLVIDDNDGVRNTLLEFVRRRKMIALGAANGLEGLQRAKSFPPKDLIVVSSDLKDIATAYLVNSLREDFYTRDTPIILICAEGRQEATLQVYQSVPQFKGLVPRGDDKTPLNEAMVQAAIKKAMEASQKSKSKTEEVAQKAVIALASIADGNKVFNLAAARDALAELLQSPHDFLRLPAIIALGNLGDSKVVPAFMELLTNKDTNTTIRLQVVKALGQIFNKNGDKLNKENVGRILAIFQEKNSDAKFAELKQHTFRLLGQAIMTPEDRRSVFENHRVHNLIAGEQKSEEIAPGEEKTEPPADIKKEGEEKTEPPADTKKEGEEKTEPPADTKKEGEEKSSGENKEVKEERPTEKSAEDEFSSEKSE